MRPPIGIDIESNNTIFLVECVHFYDQFEYRCKGRRDNLIILLVPTSVAFHVYLFYGALNLLIFIQTV